jgi:ABC-2 type transport system ATP-binding protein
MVERAIQTRDLAKTFPGGIVAVSGLDLQVPRGAVFGLIGRNGAGKTTTLRLLMGLLRPDRGTAEMLGMSLWNAPRELRSRVAYVSQAQQLHGWMTLAELCRYTSYFYERWDPAYARELARRWGMDWHRQVGRLSAGEQRKAAMLLAFASRPEVLLLDEPAATLDPIARRELIDEILAALTSGDGCTVLFSTHLIGDLERIAEYVGIMDRGRLIVSERLEDLQRRTKRVQVIFPEFGPPNDFSIPGALRTQTAGPVVHAIATLSDDAQLDNIRRLPGVRVNLFSLGLEEIFIELFGRNGSAELTDEKCPAEVGEAEAARNIVSIN